MNSLSDLNSFGSTSISSTDNRTPDLTFDKPISSDGTVTLDFISGSPGTHTVPIGININEIIIPLDSLPTYTIDLNNASGNATLAWATLPSGVTSSTPSANAYRVSGLSTVAHWNTIKSPTITLNSNFSGTFTYTATITWNTTETVSWTVTVSALSAGVIGITRSNVTYTGATTVLVNGSSPLIVDTGYDGTGSYTMTVVPNPTSAVTTLSSTGRKSYTQLQILSNPNPESSDQWGNTNDISSDGKYMVVGNSADNVSTGQYGGIDIYFRSSTTFALQQSIDSPTSADDNFGHSVSISGDGARIAVLAYNTNKIFVYSRTSTTWSLETSFVDAGAQVHAVRLSKNGSNLVTFGSTLKSYTRNGTTWTFQSSIATSGYLGYGAQLSYDGNVATMSDPTFDSVTEYTQAPKTITQNGSVTVNTTTKKYGAGSMYFGGSSSLKIASQSDFAFGTGNFTIEFWVYRSSNARTETLVDFRSSGNTNAPWIYVANNTLRYHLNGATRITKNDTLFANTWYHVAIIRVGNITTLKILGANEGTYTDSTSLSAMPLVIGGNYQDGEYLQGYLDDVRVCNNARYQIVDSVEELYPSANELVANANTKLLINANSSIVDVSGSFKQNVGKVYIYSRSSGVWTQQATIEGSVAEGQFGGELFLSNSGTRLGIIADNNSFIYDYATTWNLTTTFTSNRLYALSEDGNDAVIGTNIYKLITGSWTLTESYSNTLNGIVNRFSKDGNYLLASSFDGLTPYGKIVVHSSTTVGTSFNSGTKTLTLTGTRSQINSDLDTIVMIRPSGLTATFTLNYTVTTPRSTTASRSQTFTYSS